MQFCIKYSSEWICAVAGDLAAVTAKNPRKPQTYREASEGTILELNQKERLQRPSAKEPQPSAYKNISRTAENRVLNRTNEKVV